MESGLASHGKALARDLHATCRRLHLSDSCLGMLGYRLWVSFESKNAMKKSVNSEVPFMHSFLFLFIHRFDKCTLRPY